MEEMSFADGTILSYRSAGTGIPLLLLHAPLIGHVNFVAQKPLEDRFRLIIPDLPGHGASSSLSEPYPLSVLARKLCELIRRSVKEKTIVCGYSQGGSLALACLLAEPELFAGGVLVSGFSEVDDLYLHSRFYMAEAMVRLHGTRLLASSITSSHLDDPAAIQLWLEHMKKTDSDSLLRLYQAGHLYNCSSQLSAITSPLLLLYGEEDHPMQRYANKIKEHVPHAHLHYVPGVKHQIVTKAAHTFHEHLDLFAKEITTERTLILSNGR
ncbi:MAG: alpha/beta fold hydrolase [Clostridia bacterium]